MKSDKIKFNHVEGSKRLRGLRKAKRVSYDILEKNTGINKQSLKNYERAGEGGTEFSTRGDAFAGMNVNNLVTLANYFGVSTDYLLGLTEENNYTNDETVKMISDYTGLSTEAVKHLHHYAREEKPYEEYLSIIGEMLSNANFYQAMAYLVRAKRLKKRMDDKRKENPSAYDQTQGLFEYFSDVAIMSGKNDNNNVTLNLRQSIEFYLLRAVDSFRKESEYLVKGD